MLGRFKRLKPGGDPASDQHAGQTVPEDPDGTFLARPARAVFAPPRRDYHEDHAPLSSIPLPTSVASSVRLVDCRKVGGFGEFHLTAASTMVTRKDEWGMSGSSVLVIHDPGISRNHATIELRGTKHVLRDLGSANGSFVNDVPVKGDVTLQHGDVIRFHTFAFQFVVAARDE